MKFDLHFHTKREKWENEEWYRNEDARYESLSKEIDENDVGIVGITNHYSFDENDFNKLKKRIDTNVLIVPGIECSVKIEKEIIHFTINTMDKEFLKRLDHKNKKHLEIKKFVEIIKKNNNLMIIGIHFLKKRGFKKIEDIDNFIIDNNLNFNNILIILDFPNNEKIKDFGIGNKYPTFSFSDISSLKEYSKKSKELPELKFLKGKFQKFNYLFEIIKNDSLKITPTSYSFKDKFSNIETTIDLYPGLNIVFGNKGSGKTEFLKNFENSNKNKSFKRVDFSKFIIQEKNLFKLFKSLKEDKLINEKKLKNLDENLKMLKEGKSLENLKKMKKNWDIKPFIKNISSEVESKWIINEKKKINYFSIPYQDKKIILKKERDYYKKIYENLFKIIEIIKKSEYKGSIKMNDFKKAFNKNEEDFKKTIILNHYNLKDEIIKNLHKEFKSTSYGKIGINENITNMIKNLKEKKEIYDFWTEKKKIIIDNDKRNIIATEALEGELILSWNFCLKSDKICQKIDAQNLYKGETQKKIYSSDFLKNFENFIEIMEKEKIWEIVDFDINQFKEEKLKLVDFYFIYFKSSYQGIENYIPSTGEYDMIKISKFLQNNNDLIIDEFCNNLDNEYIYKILLPLIKKFKGKILASTHNPIISSVGYCQKYIFLKREHKEFMRYETNDSIYGFLLNKNDKIETKKQIINTIEGTKEAFNWRRGKYEL